jgi:hypothetical protein
VAIGTPTRNAGATSTAASTLSWSHTVGASENFLTVCADLASAVRPTISSVVWDAGGANTALTRKGGAPESAGFGGADIWSLTAPVSGTKTITVTYSGSCECGTGSSSWSGVDQTTPFNAASPQTATGTGTAAQPNLSVTSTAGEWVIDSVIDAIAASLDDTLVVNVSQTQISNHDRGAGKSSGASSDEAAVGASTAMTWTGVGASDTWAQVGVSLRPASVGGAGVSLYLNENGVDRFLLENGSGVLLLEGSDSPTLPNMGPERYLQAVKRGAFF